MSTDTLPEIIRCNLCGHSAELHRFASPVPACAACPNMECVGTPPPPRPLGRLFADVVSGTVDPSRERRTTAEAAWQLVLDTWRVVEVASARALVPATCNRDEWMAALRLAIFRADHAEPDPSAGSYRASDPCDMCEGTVSAHEPGCRLA